MAKETRVLVVDDDISFAESLTDILMAKGYDAVAVNSGEKALEKIKERFFDVVGDGVINVVAGAFDRGRRYDAAK